MRFLKRLAWTWTRNSYLYTHNTEKEGFIKIVTDQEVRLKDHDGRPFKGKNE